MNVVERLVGERNRCYDVVKKNCVRQEIHTGDCQDCHQLQDNIDTYNAITLNEFPVSDEDTHKEQQQETPLDILESESESTQKEEQFGDVPLFL